MAKQKPEQEISKFGLVVLAVIISAVMVILFKPEVVSSSQSILVPMTSEKCTKFNIGAKIPEMLNDGAENGLQILCSNVLGRWKVTNSTYMCETRAEMDCSDARIEEMGRVCLNYNARYICAQGFGCICGGE